MDWRIVVPVVVAIIGAILSGTLSIIAYFLKEKNDGFDKRLSKCEADSQKNLADVARLEQTYKLDLARVEQAAKDKLQDLETKLTAKLNELRLAIDHATRSSVTDESDARLALQKELQGKYDEVRKDISDIRTNLATWKATSDEKFISRTDFIRDSAALDAKISGVHRSIHGMEASVDTLLKKYLGDR